MRWVAWVVLLAACAKPGGGTAPAPSASGQALAASVAPSVAAAPVPCVAASGTPPAASPSVAAEVARPPASVDGIGRELKGSSRMCEVVLPDGLRVLRPCTGTGNETATAIPARGKWPNCLVTVGDLEIIRPCEGKPNERPAPSKPAARAPKMCEFIEHSVEGDLVRLGPCK